MKVRMTADSTCDLFREVLETMAGCTVCTHCGPNTLGIMFVRKEKET